MPPVVSILSPGCSPGPAAAMDRPPRGERGPHRPTRVMAVSRKNYKKGEKYRNTC